MTTMDRQTLIERLRGIEWDDFEVKEATGGLPKNAYETVSAFANTSGGWIVFGVKESKPGFEVVGVPDPDAMQNDFLGACRSAEKFSRPVEVRPHHFSLDGSSVLAFYVAPARRFDKPVRVRIDKGWHTYVCVADRSLARLATGESAIRTREILEHLEQLRLVEPLGGDGSHIRLAHPAKLTKPGDHHVPAPAVQVAEQVAEQVSEQVQRLILGLGDRTLSTTELMVGLTLQHRDRKSVV